MRDPDHWKLGAFVIAALALTVVILVTVGLGATKGPTRPAVTYFAAPVDGLQPGAQVTLLGIDIGHVTAVGLAPDLRHAEVEVALSTHRLQELGVEPGAGTRLRAQLPPDLRLTLAGGGLTGATHLRATYVDDPATPPSYPFELPEHFVPSTPPLMAELESGATEVMAEVPRTLRQITTTAERIELAIRGMDLERSELGPQIAATGESFQQAVADLRSLRGDLRHTLHAAAAAAERVSALAALLEREPGALVHGRSPVQEELP